MSDGVVGPVVERARTALAAFAGADQATVDEAVVAIGWSLYRPDHAEALARMAVAETGLGNLADKTDKNRRKTLGTLRDLLRATTVGLLDVDEMRGIARYAKPVGVVAALTPSTNPAATAFNKIMMAVKAANAVVVAPSPSAWNTTANAVELARGALTQVGAPADLVQVLPRPVTREATDELMAAADLVVATGSEHTVSRAYRSGTPTIGVGVGNAPVIVDATADVDDAAVKIAWSKSFDNATSCSSENALVIVDEIYDDAVAALERAGAHLASAEEAARIEQRLFPGGQLNRELVARDLDVLAEAFEIATAPMARFVMVEQTTPGPDQPLSGEKLSLVLALYRAQNFDHAVEIARAILAHQGRGHSAGIHSQDRAHAERLARELDVVRVLVNQAHAIGNGGAFDNGLPFTLSMGCGTWGGNSISENLHVGHFLNVTHLVTTIAEDRPSEEEIFGAHWARHGR